MKKLLAISFALFTILTVHAQYSTGNTDKKWDRFVLGGSVNFHYRQGFQFNSKGYTFKPYIGKVISDRWIVGLQLNVEQSHNEQLVFNGQDRVNVIRRNTDLGVEVFGRFTFNPKNKLQVYLRPYLGYTYHENNVDRYDQHERFSEINAGLDLGLTYQISKRINITARFGNLNISEQINHTGSSGYGRSIDLDLRPSSISLGAEIKF